MNEKEKAINNIATKIELLYKSESVTTEDLGYNKALLQVSHLLLEELKN